MTPTHRLGSVLALAFFLHASFSAGQTSRFDWSDITAIAWADASIVPPDTRPAKRPLNTPDAVRRIRNAAEGGDPLAQFRLGRAYEDGDGVPADAEQAHRWYRKAADQRFASAEFAVGMDYARGQGVQLDIEEAVEWIRRAATQGHALAQYSLGMAYATRKGIERDGQASTRRIDKGPTGELLPQNVAVATFVLYLLLCDLSLPGSVGPRSLTTPAQIADG